MLYICSILVSNKIIYNDDRSRAVPSRLLGPVACGMGSVVY